MFVVCNIHFGCHVFIVGLDLFGFQRTDCGVKRNILFWIFFYVSDFGGYFYPSILIQTVT